MNLASFISQYFSLQNRVVHFMKPKKSSVVWAISCVLCAENPCLSTPCASRATCFPYASHEEDFYCSCPPGWTGELCEQGECSYEVFQFFSRVCIALELKLNRRRSTLHFFEIQCLLVSNTFGFFCCCVL